MVDKKTWYYKYLKAAISRIWGWSPERRKVLRDAEVGAKWQCALCKGVVERKLRAVDHIDPSVRPEAGMVSWDSYIERSLGTSASNLQVVCKACHTKKTNAEGRVRRATKANKRNPKDAL